MLSRQAHRFASVAFNKASPAFTGHLHLQQYGSASVAVQALNNAMLLHQAGGPSHAIISPRSFSSDTSLNKTVNVISKSDLNNIHPGTITKKLKALDGDIVRKIYDDLKEVDANYDERIDADELKVLLRKHNFSDDEVMGLSELWYDSKAGESVSFHRFIEAIDYASHQKISKDAQEDGEVHPWGRVGQCSLEYHFQKHHHYAPEELDINLTHVKPEGFRDNLAYATVKAVRFAYDLVTGWKSGQITTEKILHRVIFLETVAAVPGMVAAIVRHFRSLRNMQRDGGMLQMFLEEANNERMHLLTFVTMKDPSQLFRLAVIGGQFGFGSLFLISYLINPKFCHRFVGYIEEEACDTYTKIIKAIEEAPEGSDLAQWRYERAPKIAISYWKLGEEGTVLDLMYAVRADEAEHRDVNHVCSGLDQDQSNPLYDPQEQLDTMLVKYVKDLMNRDQDKRPLAA